MGSDLKIWEDQDVVCINKLELKNGPIPEDFGKASYQLLRAMDLGPQREIVIKPNVVLPLGAESGIVTHPAFVGGIIDYLRETGLKSEEIFVAEGGGVEVNDDTQNTLINFRECGYTTMADQKGVRLVDLNKDQGVRISLPDGKLFSEIGIARTVKSEGRFVINAPKLKTHNLAVTTLSMKNLQGAIVPISERHLCTLNPLDLMPDKLPRKNSPYPDIHPRSLPKEERAKWLKIEPSGLTVWEEKWCDKICDLSLAIRPDLNIVEGIVGRDGSGFKRGHNYNTGLVVAGVNPVAVDSVATYLIGFNPKEVGYLRRATERCIGSNEVEKLRIYISEKDKLIPCENVASLLYKQPFSVIRGWEELLAEGL